MKTLFPELDEAEVRERELSGATVESGSPRPLVAALQQASPVPTFRNCPILEPVIASAGVDHADVGWWFGTPFPDWPHCGPYATRRECEEMRASFVRNWIGHFKQSEICTSC